MRFQGPHHACAAAPRVAKRDDSPWPNNGDGKAMVARPTEGLPTVSHRAAWGPVGKDTACIDCYDLSGKDDAVPIARLDAVREHRLQQVNAEDRRAAAALAARETLLTEVTPSILIHVEPSHG